MSQHWPLHRAPHQPLPFFLSVLAGTNPCSMNNGDCSQLCLPTSETSRSCMCTAGYSLKSGQQSCEGEHTRPIPVSVCPSLEQSLCGSTSTPRGQAARRTGTEARVLHDG